MGLFSFDLSGGYSGSKEKTRETPVPFYRTEELSQLFEDFMQEFVYGDSYANALQKAAAKLKQAIGVTRGRYETDIAGPRKEYFGENRGLLSQLISDTQANRKPINIGFGGEDLMTFTPYTNQLAKLVGQRSGMEGDYFTGASQDIGYLDQLAREAIQAGLLPKEKLLELYTNIMLPLELKRFDSDAMKTSGHAYGGTTAGSYAGGGGE